MEMTLKEKRTKAEPGSASPLESNGEIHLITSKCRPKMEKLYTVSKNKTGS